ncbi:MAG TPA: response regulator [Bryobacteraceae bacterium]|nr:response regulator [Bryobacteraceae bacterium]
MNSVSERTNAAPVRLLLVDDHPAGLAARTSVLTELGFAITSATSAEAALEKFQSDPFPLVVTDYKLPGKTGVDLIAGIRAVAPETRIVLISGFVDALGLTEHSTGADAVLSKSANEVSQLIRAVNRLLRRSVAKKPGSARKSSSRRTGTAG